MRKEYIKTGLMAALVLLLGAALFWEIAEYSRAIAANANDEIEPVVPGKEIMLMSAKKDARLILIEPDKMSISCYRMTNRKFRLVHTRNYKADFFFEDMADTPIESASTATVKEIEDYIPRYDKEQKLRKAAEDRLKGRR